MTNVWIERIETLLTDNNVKFETTNYSKDCYINILNSATMTRIHIFEYIVNKSHDLTATAIKVQEFDATGKQTYDREFANIGKAFIKRVTKNIG